MNAYEINNYQMNGYQTLLFRETKRKFFHEKEYQDDLYEACEIALKSYLANGMAHYIVIDSIGRINVLIGRVALAQDEIIAAVIDDENTYTSNDPDYSDVDILYEFALDKLDEITE